MTEIRRCLRVTQDGNYARNGNLLIAETCHCGSLQGAIANSESPFGGSTIAVETLSWFAFLGASEHATSPFPSRRPIVDQTDYWDPVRRCWLHLHVIWTRRFRHHSTINHRRQHHSQAHGKLNHAGLCSCAHITRSPQQVINSLRHSPCPPITISTSGCHARASTATKSRFRSRFHPGQRTGPGPPRRPENSLAFSAPLFSTEP